MTRVFDERWEASGTDETWSQTLTETNCTVDDDKAVSAAGSPSGWGSLCMENLIENGTNDNAWKEEILSSAINGIVYTRVEVVIGAESLSDGENNPIFKSWDTSYAKQVFGLEVGQSSGNLFFKLRINADGTGSDNTTDSTGTISTATRYRLEVKVDFTGNLWRWWLDGVSQGNGLLTDTHPTEFVIARLGIVNGNAGMTVYHDLFAIDDANMIGAEDGSSDGVVVSPSGLVSGGLLGGGLLD